MPASVSGVAIEFGFFDQSHFTRHFRRKYGLTPARSYGKASFAQRARIGPCRSRSPVHTCVRKLGAGDRFMATPLGMISMPLGTGAGITASRSRRHR
jgi:AraC-like DNA-binding protein